MGRRKTKEKEPVTIRFKELANGNQSIYLDIYQDGKRKYEFLKLYLLPEKGRDRAEARRKNSETMAVANVIKAQRVLDIKNGMADIKSKNSHMRLLDWMQIYAKKKLKNTKSYGDATRNLESTMYHVKQYIGEDTKLKDIDKKFCLGFIGYLKKAKTKKGEMLHVSTQRLYYSILNGVLNSAVNEGMILFNPFSRIDSSDKPKSNNESSRVYLTIDELRLMEQTECSEPKVKQAFMFACFCGLRISDIRSLKWSDIEEYTDADGTKHYRLSIVMEKTKKTLSYQLSGEAMKWLPEKTDEVFVFHKLTRRSKLAYVLREWAEAAGIKKNVTFHVSRHTFATMMLTLGADIYTTSKLLGHTQVSTTEIYAKIVDKKKDDAMGLIDKFFDK